MRKRLKGTEEGTVTVADKTIRLVLVFCLVVFVAIGMLVTMFAIGFLWAFISNGV